MDINRAGTTSAANSIPSSEISKNSPRTGHEQQAPELREGQIVKGEVIDLRFHEVKVMLEPGKQVITAKLSGDIPISIGQTAEFQISGDSTEGLVLKYLPPENQLFLDLTLQKALTASGLPLTEKNKAIVMELLKYQLPIDKKTIQDLIKHSILHREATPQILVLMHKFHIPITEANIRQFFAYQNQDHQLLNGLNKLSANILEILRQEIQAPEAITPENSIADPLSTLGSRMQDVVDNIIADKIIPTFEQPSAANDPTSTLPAVCDPASDKIAARGDLLIEEVLPEEIRQTGNQIKIGTILGKDGLELFGKLLEQWMKDRSDIPKSLQADLTEAAGKGSLPLADSIRLIMKLSPGKQSDQLPLPLPSAGHNPLPEEQGSGIMKILTDRYLGLLEEKLHQKWTITPDQLSEKESVAEYYESLKKDLDQLNEFLNNNKDITHQKNPEPVRNLLDNLRFMKALNEFVSYVQLPVHLKDKDVHGDFYVFRKKNVPQGIKDHLNVLLHLDMAELGPLNIHMTMELSRIQANFYIEDPVSGQIVSEHLTDLAKLLSEKGYLFQARVEKSYQQIDFITDILEQDAPDSSVQRYSFDIRT